MKQFTFTLPLSNITFDLVIAFANELFYTSAKGRKHWHLIDIAFVTFDEFPELRNLKIILPFSMINLAYMRHPK